jgi:hypothetical protein
MCVCCEGNITRPVPTRDGKLVPIDVVYTSWLRDGCYVEDGSDFTSLPDFQPTGSRQRMALADPRQINLVDQILTHLGICHDTAFTMRVTEDPVGGDSRWQIISLADSVRIMCMVCNAKCRGVEHGGPLLVNKPSLAVTFRSHSGRLVFAVHALPLQHDANASAYRCEFIMNATVASLLQEQHRGMDQ